MAGLQEAHQADGPKEQIMTTTQPRAPRMLMRAAVLVLALTALLMGALPPAGAAGNNNERKLHVRVLLEGALLTGQPQMQTGLDDVGVLPIADPYGLSPDRDPSLNNVVDWVRVEVRDAANPSVVVDETSGLLRTNGRIRSSINNQMPTVDVPAGDYIVVVFHQSHLPAASHPVTVQANKPLKYNFTKADTGPFQVGAHQVAVGPKWAMFSGNVDQTSPAATYDINGADLARWSAENGMFRVYLSSDTNMDGDINGADRIFFNKNNGVFSAIPPRTN